MNIKQRLQDFKSTFNFCKKIRILLVALCLMVLADRYWLVEVDRHSLNEIAIENIEPASGGDPQEVLSNITFSKLYYEELPKESVVDQIKAKIPGFNVFSHEDSKAQPGLKKIAIVIDDLGIDKKRSRAILEMDHFKMTLAFLPYATNLEPLIEKSIENGHEIIVHMPMQPLSDTIDPGPVALKVGMTKENLENNLEKGLTAFDGFKGINNHMGSKFTADYVGMDFLMRELKERNLYFLDSVTSPKSLAKDRASHHGVTYLRRNVFLDHEMTDQFVSKALSKCKVLAERDGVCIAIGHPKDVTINGLKSFVNQAQDEGFEFVSLSDLIDTNNQSSNNLLVKVSDQ